MLCIILKLLESKFFFINFLNLILIKIFLKDIKNTLKKNTKDFYQKVLINLK